jgi:hypothetical protein
LGRLEKVPAILEKKMVPKEKTDYFSFLKISQMLIFQHFQMLVRYRYSGRSVVTLCDIRFRVDLMTYFGSFGPYKRNIMKFEK